MQTNDLPQVPEELNGQVRKSYPAPPNVHWGVLFAAQLVIPILAAMLAPRAYWNLISSLAADAWILYICLWVRRLNPDFMSLFWCVAYVALQLAFSVPGAPVTVHRDMSLLTACLVLLDALLWIVSIYVLRAELHFHYNETEPVGLYLSGVMTFFFSYLYFQYHLQKIAQLKERYGDRPFYYMGGPTLPPEAF